MPTWEHEANQNGGRWSFFTFESIDQQWLIAMLSLIGETLSNSELVLGGVCSTSGKKSRVQIWVSTNKEEDQHELMEIGLSIRNTLKLGREIKLEYTVRFHILFILYS